MSLDVSLMVPRETPEFEGTGVYLRDGEGFREVSVDEWEHKMSRSANYRWLTEPMPTTQEVWTYNITHNLGNMAGAAGLYEVLWRPEELGITCARELIEPLKDGLTRLQERPEGFRALNPSNGWGNYEGLVNFVTAYLTACEAHPDAGVGVSR